MQNLPMKTSLHPKSAVYQKVYITGVDLVAPWVCTKGSCCDLLVNMILTPAAHGGTWAHLHGQRVDDVSLMRAAAVGRMQLRQLLQPLQNRRPPERDIPLICVHLRMRRCCDRQALLFGGA